MKEFDDYWCLYHDYMYGHKYAIGDGRLFLLRPKAVEWEIPFTSKFTTYD